VDHQNPLLTNKTWCKLCKDTGLISRRFTRTDADLIFTKIKLRGQTKINFDTFRRGLHFVAERRGLQYPQIAEVVIGAGGPVLNGTLAEHNRFHDDKSTYTGVYARGGPTKVDNSLTQSNLTDRDRRADVRGVPQLPSRAEYTGADAGFHHHNPHGMDVAGSGPRMGASNGAQPAHNHPQRRMSRSGSTDSESEYAEKAAREQAYEMMNQPLSSVHQSQLRKLFASFCTRGSNTMDSARFQKLLRDCDVLGKHVNQTDADLIFQAVKRGGNYAKTIDFETFRDDALPRVAGKFGVQVDIVVSHMLQGSGPTWSGTRAEATRFHDDKTTYTGVYARGGPTKVDNKPSMSNLTDRDRKADVRGVVRLPARADYTGSQAQFHQHSPSMEMNTGGVRMKPRAMMQADPRGRHLHSSRGTRIRRSSRERRGSDYGRKNGGDIYDRLNNVDSYTGVYKQRFTGGPNGGRINGDTVNTKLPDYSGHTNSSTDAKIRDISDVLRR